MIPKTGGVMSKDILCKKCGHSLGFHGWYGACEAPVDGKKFYNRCGCTWTNYSEIKDLQAKLDEKLEIIDEQAETIVNFAFDEQHLKAKLDIAVEALKKCIFLVQVESEQDAKNMDEINEAIKKLEEK